MFYHIRAIPAIRMATVPVIAPVAIVIGPITANAIEYIFAVVAGIVVRQAVAVIRSIIEAYDTPAARTRPVQYEVPTAVEPTAAAIEVPPMDHCMVAMNAVGRGIMPADAAADVHVVVAINIDRIVSVDG